MGKIIIPSEEVKRPNLCCNIEANIDHFWEYEDLEVEQCKICGCRHTRFHLNPKTLKMNIG